MTGRLGEFIGRVVSRAGPLPRSARSDLERELRAHFEDALAQSTTADDATREALQRFGDPVQVGRALKRVHRFERWMFLAADAAVLMIASVLAVTVVVVSFQIFIAWSAGISPAHAFPRLKGQAVGFVSLSLGYMSLHWEERTLKNFRLVPAFLLNLFAFMWLFAGTAQILGLRTSAAGIPFLAGGLVRILQRTPLRSLWFAGVILPSVATALDGGRLLNPGGSQPLWIAIPIRCLVQIAACYSLTLMSERHNRRNPPLDVA